MKDFVRDAWRIAVACAAGAFVLSLVIGLIAANPFGIALSRAFLLGLLFAALGVGLRAVVKAYLPEVFGAAPSPGDARGEGRAGSVDIVLPEDEALQRKAFRRPAGADGAAGEGDEERAPSRQDADEEPSEVLEAPEEEDASTAEARALGALAEELGEEPESIEEDGGGSEEAAGDERRSAASPGEGEAEETQSEEMAHGEEPAELDALPDLAELEPPPQRNGPAPRVPRAAVGESPEDAVRNLLSNQDPATLARAIRTSLKKDEKG